MKLSSWSSPNRRSGRPKIWSRPIRRFADLAGQKSGPAQISAKTCPARPSRQIMRQNLPGPPIQANYAPKPARPARSAAHPARPAHPGKLCAKTCPYAPKPARPAHPGKLCAKTCPARPICRHPVRLPAPHRPFPPRHVSLAQPVPLNRPSTLASPEIKRVVYSRTLKGYLSRSHKNAF